MNINEIIKYSGKPEIYTKGTAVMWTDEHISKQLLQVHLNPEVDLASRKKTTIEKTISWILDKTKKEKMSILDLGCGPGQYTEILARKGHKVTGVDFSKNSIEYAQQSAKGKGLAIEYRNQNYLELDEENKYDLVILIYTDLGVLLPMEREKLLSNIYKALKPGGIFIFDVLNNNDIEKKISPKNWEVAKNGFWRNNAYITLSESFLYADEKVILSQHIVMEEINSPEVYRFWIHCFNHSDINEMIAKGGFVNPQYFEDVLPKGNLWNGENVTFCVTEKR